MRNHIDRATIECTLGYGVIGNTTDSGSVILGSSPGIPAKILPL